MNKRENPHILIDQAFLYTPRWIDQASKKKEDMIAPSPKTSSKP